MGSLGDLVVTGSHDRSLRRWERTEEPFFVEEEKEKRLESLFEADLEVRWVGRGSQGGWPCCSVLPLLALCFRCRHCITLTPPACLCLCPQAADRAPLGQETPGEEGAVALAGRKTLETVGAADEIIEALDLAADEEERLQEFEQVGGCVSAGSREALVGRRTLRGRRRGLIRLGQAESGGALRLASRWMMKTVIPLLIQVID